MVAKISKERTGTKYDLYFDDSNEFGSKNIRFTANSDTIHMILHYSDELKVTASDARVEQEDLQPLMDYVEKNIQTIKDYCDKKITKDEFLQIM